MPRICIFACALAIAAGAIAATGDPPALASHNQVTYFEGSNILLNPAKRPRAIAQLRSRGVKALRVKGGQSGTDGRVTRCRIERCQLLERQRARRREQRGFKQLREGLHA